MKTMFMMLMGCLIVIGGDVIISQRLRAQTVNCNWINVTSHSTYCHTQDGDYGNGNACWNFDEGCCLYYFDITNIWSDNIVRVDICAVPKPAGCLPRVDSCTTVVGQTEICEYCGTYPKNTLVPIWPEDGGCSSTLFPVFPSTTLADGYCDSLCRSNCLHVKAPDAGLPKDSVLRVNIGFTGNGADTKCVTICVTFAGTTTPQCCEVTLPVCALPGGPSNLLPCPPSPSSNHGEELGSIDTSPIIPRVVIKTSGSR